MEVRKNESPSIGLIITHSGVKGIAVFGDSLAERQKSLSLLELLEPDLIEIQNRLNHRIESLKNIEGFKK